MIQQFHIFYISLME